MALQSGARVGPYEVTALIGEGGMGEVYRAHDTRLGRNVAIKILPTSEPERLARFEREAQVLASLNHPNIAAIHHVEETSDGPALVMELVEGDTLADRIAHGAIPIDEALPIAKQIAEALEAAHEQGIIHRDLKPANIKVRPDGTVKVLDFGLAKLSESMTVSNAPSALSMSPTITSPALISGVGTLLGTAAYMSPEQARGKSVDRRADLWAFGCVVFEMLTGKRAFDGEDVTEVLARVLERQPDFAALPQTTPPALRRLLHQCLEKDQKHRLDSAVAARLAIDEAFAPAAHQPPIHSERQPVRHARSAWGIAAVAIAAAVFLVVWTSFRDAPPAAPVARLEIVPSSARALWNASPESRNFAISPDGTRVVYVGSATSYGDRQLILRRLDEIDGTPLPGTAGARGPFFSPDGRWLAFFAGNEIKKILIAGGSPLSVCHIESFVDNQEASGGWMSDDRIIFSTDQDQANLLVVPAAGGEPKVLARIAAGSQERGFGFPAEIGGTHSLLLTVKLFTGRPRRIDALNLDSGIRKTIVADGDMAHYIENGYMVYRAGGTLRAIRFDSERMEVSGDPVTLIAGGTPTSGFSVARSGTLAYVLGDAGVPGQRNGGERSLVWVDRQGRETPTGTPPRSYGSFRLSPDGSRAAIDIRDPEGSVWIWDFGRQTLSRLSASSDAGTNPVWTPDGLRVAYNIVRAELPWVVTQRADGTGRVEQLTNQPFNAVTKAVTPDGRAVLTAGSGGPGGAGAMGLVLLNQRTDGQVLLQGTGSQNNPDVSPDGHWLAYDADASGVREVYVRPFPNVNDGRWQVSTDGGRQPVWRRDGRELFYLDKDDILTAVAIQPGETFTASQPKRVLQTRYASPGQSRAYDVSRDGQRFLMMKDISAEGSPDRPNDIVVVLNWDQELKRLLPPK